jgi:HK97 gp10 family phage protein
LARRKRIGMLTSRIPKIIVFSEAAASAAVRKAEMAIERRAKAKSRVDTGNMRGAWQSRSMGAYEGMVFNLVSYAIFNEYGTVNMSAQPMLRPAVEETRPEFEHDLRLAYA